MKGVLPKVRGVPEQLFKTVQKEILRPWRKKYGKFTTMIGHSRGGMFASQIAYFFPKLYRKVQIITFNGFKPKEGPNQIHFLTQHEHAVSVVSSSDKYTRVPFGHGHLRLYINHSLNSFAEGLYGLHQEMKENVEAEWEALFYESQKLIKSKMKKTKKKKKRQEADLDGLARPS
jgi:hypothetical protein